MTSENAAPAEMPGEEQVRDIIQTVVNQCTSEPTEWSDCVDDATAAILAALAKEREKAFIAGWMSANPDTSDNPGHGEWLLQAATRDWAEWAQEASEKSEGFIGACTVTITRGGDSYWRAKADQLQATLNAERKARVAAEAALAAEREKAHYANGVAELAMKHRDEAEREALRDELTRLEAAAPLSARETARYLQVERRLLELDAAAIRVARNASVRKEECRRGTCYETG